MEEMPAEQSDRFDVLFDAFESALDDALRCDQRVRAGYARLATARGCDAVAFDAVVTARADRDALLRRLGGAVVDWVAAGGLLSLDEPALVEDVEDVEAEPGPQPEVDDAASEPAVEASEPACPAEPAAEPASPAASTTELAALSRHLEGGGAFHAGPTLVVESALPVELLRGLGPTPPLDGAAAWRDELARLDGVIRARGSWPLAAADHRTLVTLLAARLRRLQDAAPGCGIRHKEAALPTRHMRDLSAHVKGADIGWVHGLAKKHRPHGASWTADAEVWWRRLAGRAGLSSRATPEALLRELRAEIEAGLAPGDLVDAVERAVQRGLPSDHPELLDIAAPHASLFEAAARCKTLRAALKERSAADDAEQAAADARMSQVPNRILTLTRGKRAVVVGGDRRNQALERMQRAFAFATVDWETGQQLRRVESLAASIQRGGVDIVIFLKRFLSHAVTEKLAPALKGNPDVRDVWVDGGYGVAAVVRAFEGPAAR